MAPGPRRAALVSALAGIAILAAKLGAWALTGSTAVLADGLESVANVAAALFALGAIAAARRPADEDHPYGHGKIEHLAAGFEGGLVLFAAASIVIGAVRALVEGPSLRALDLGLGVTAVAGVANYVLGRWLVGMGDRTGSPALVADGQHVLSDVWTTVGVLAGLGLVRITGSAWLDPITALAVGALLARAGYRLARGAIDALVDREDTELLGRLRRAFAEASVDGLGPVRRVRAIRYGDRVHVDAHVEAPATWTVQRAHDASVELVRLVCERTQLDAEIDLHVDPG